MSQHKNDDAGSVSTRAREFHFTAADFAFVQKTVYDYAGISLADHKTDMVYSRLSRRLRTLGLSAFAQYRDYLQHNDDEIVQFINALTTNLTHFFREHHHFDFIREKLMTELCQRHQLDKRIRFWCAGCSTGEEPYSLAMTLHESMASLSGWDIKILATDLDTQVLDKARIGRYEWDRVKDLDAARLKKWFKADADNAAVTVSDALRRLITFKQLNLMGDWPMKGPFDVIFCRNVVIYFDKPTQANLFQRYYDLLTEQGVLMLGHSESLGVMQGHFKTIGRTMFRKSEGGRKSEGLRNKTGGQ